MEFPKESPAHCPMSRPQVDVAKWISLVCSCSVATSLLLLQPDSLLLPGLMVATSFVVATLFAQCFSRVNAATTVSCRDIIVLLFIWFLSRDCVGGLLPSQVSNLRRDLKVMSRPLLMSISFLLVATSVLCCNQFPSFNLYSRSRPQGDVATSCCSFSGCV